MANINITYNGVPGSKAGKDGRKNSDIAIIGMPYDMGGVGLRRGQCLAPDTIRGVSDWPDSMRSTMHNIDPIELLSIVDTGDIDLEGIQDATTALTEFQKHYVQVMKNSRMPLVIGGDQTVTAKAIEAWSQINGDQITVFHFDAYGDYDKQSKVLDQNSWVRQAIDNGHALRVVQFGIRGWGIDQVESSWASKNDVYTYLANTPRTMERLYQELTDTGGSIYFTIDISVVDPAFAPGVSYPEPGGITSRELFAMTHAVMMSGKVVAADVMEVAPPFDMNGATVKLAHRTIASIITGAASAGA